MIFLGAFTLAVPLALADNDDHHVNTTLSVSLQNTNRSEVAGEVRLTVQPRNQTLISVLARGLQPGEEYVAVFYGSDACPPVQIDEGDVVGRFTANPGGVGIAIRKVNVPLRDIHSVGVLQEDALSLEACADVHP
jgi:hypothetical protein